MKLTIGRSDIADFPGLNLYGIEIKVDTGAYTSSFHCHNIELENDVLRCQFLDPEHEKYHEIFFYFKDFSEKLIKSSNGVSEKRFLVKTEILIFNETYPIELSLTERGSMQYPVLLGRKFLSKKFIVDTAMKNISYKKSKKNHLK